MMPGGKVGIGTTAPGNILDVNGAAGIGYPGTAAPTNGLIVNGEVVIGSSVATSSVALDVAGPVVSRSYNAGAATVIDFSKSNLVYTTASCSSAMTLSNMQDGGSYTLIVQGATSGTCAFTASGLTVRTPPGYGATTASSHTVFTFLRAGTNVYVNWNKGY